MCDFSLDATLKFSVIIFILIADYAGNIEDLCVIQYTFKFGEHDVKVQPHGNVRHNSDSYVQTQPSILQKIKEKQMSSSSTPKSVVAEITKEEGGIIECRSSSCLPQNRHQVSNAQYSNSLKPNHDLLYAVMEMCMKSKSEGEKFVQCVQAAPEPMCVLALEQQLLDLQRFCTCEDEFTVLGFDPTFNCGKFSVTVTAYRNLMLRSSMDGTVPTFLGPMLVHQWKLKGSYHYLISSIIGAHPPLSYILAVGTDGESNLSAGLLNNLPFAQHVRCAVHMTHDTQEKMKEVGVPKQYQGLFLEDVMGSFYSSHATGLVDAKSNEEFDKMLLNLQPIWQKREAELSSRNPLLYHGLSNMQKICVAS